MAGVLLTLDSPLQARSVSPLILHSILQHVQCNIIAAMYSTHIHLISFLQIVS